MIFPCKFFLVLYVAEFSQQTKIIYMEMVRKFHFVLFQLMPSWPHFGKKKDRSITYIKMKEIEIFGLDPPIPLSTSKVNWFHEILNFACFEISKTLLTNFQCIIFTNMWKKYIISYSHLNNYSHLWVTRENIQL